MAYRGYLTKNRLREEIGNNGEPPTVVAPLVFGNWSIAIPLSIVLLIIVFPFSVNFSEHVVPEVSDRQLLGLAAICFIISVVISVAAAFGVVTLYLKISGDYHSHPSKKQLSDDQLRIQAGADGEDLAIETASALPKEYALINQVDIPSKTGFNEADLIVVGPRCIFMIEIKHNSGKISGHPLDTKWDVEKKSNGGTFFYSEMRNPVKQVKNVTLLLSDQLKKHSSPAWIQPIVLFTHEYVRFALDKTDVPILTTEDLNSYIEFYQHENCADISEKTLSTIVELKKGKSIQ